jgi:hypothetical protein
MRIKLTYVTPLLAAGAAAVAILAAPTAAAAPTPLQQTCIATGAGTTCQSPGNVEITNTPPAVSFYPYGTMPWLLGGH